MRCPSCKADIPGGSKFCLECGAALLGRWPLCGNTNPANAKFCLECGHRIVGRNVGRNEGVRPEWLIGELRKHVAPSSSRGRRKVFRGLA
jgi:hypothetical protein